MSSKPELIKNTREEKYLKIFFLKINLLFKENNIRKGMLFILCKIKKRKTKNSSAEIIPLRK
jgi:hypothetical protein